MDQDHSGHMQKQSCAKAGWQGGHKRQGAQWFKVSDGGIAMGMCGKKILLMRVLYGIFAALVLLQMPFLSKMAGANGYVYSVFFRGVFLLCAISLLAAPYLKTKRMVSVGIVCILIAVASVGDFWSRGQFALHTVLPKFCRLIDLAVSHHISQVQCEASIDVCFYVRGWLGHAHMSWPIVFALLSLFVFVLRVPFVLMWKRETALKAAAAVPAGVDVSLVQKDGDVGAAEKAGGAAVKKEGD